LPIANLSRLPRLAVGLAVDYQSSRHSSAIGAKEVSPVCASAPGVSHGGLAKGWVNERRPSYLAPQAGAEQSGAPSTNAFLLREKKTRNDTSMPIAFPRSR